ncbi:MAG TPA: RidA family protein [Anaerolineales bacterium]|nr:RidA family protein [Anaerolineales bacterium]
MTRYSKLAISSDKAPKALGPYSAGIRISNIIYTAGQLGIIPSTGDLAMGGIEAETRQALDNLGAVLVAAGSSFSHVVKTTVFLRDMADFTRMNNIYAEYFDAPYPARSTIQVAALPKGGMIEIEAVAIIPD